MHSKIHVKIQQIKSMRVLKDSLSHPHPPTLPLFPLLGRCFLSNDGWRCEWKKLLKTIREDKKWRKLSHTYIFQRRKKIKQNRKQKTSKDTYFETEYCYRCQGKSFVIEKVVNCVKYTKTSRKMRLQKGPLNVTNEEVI